MMLSRRTFLSAAAGAACCPWSANASVAVPLEARPGLLKLAPEGFPATEIWGYDGSVPGPEIRVAQGDRVMRNLVNRLDQPTTIHWTYDTAALANGTGKAVTEAGGKKWFFLTADYAFGHALERDTTAVVTANGGEVVGQVNVPFPATDFSSFLLQAQGSGADVIGLANAGGDTVNAIKQASEFGITQAGQQLAALLMFVTDVHALGAETAQGLSLTEAFYWDLNDKTREWSTRFEEKQGAKPTMVQAGVYSATMHYLRAVEAVGSSDSNSPWHAWIVGKRNVGMPPLGSYGGASASANWSTRPSPGCSSKTTRCGSRRPR